MTFGNAFWVLMFIWLFFSSWRDWPNHEMVGRNLFLFVLFGLLGWQSFGAPLHH
jgi:hypothetical protein